MNQNQLHGQSTIRKVIKSHLNARLQILLIDNTLPHDNVSSYNWEEVKSAVPQGSILGPLHFLFYFNDLSKITSKDSNIV
jgi:hypothetical protein